jgi:hypothetical protein
MSEGDHAFAIRNHEIYAWHAAHQFHQNGRRPRVYEVEPAADMKPGPWNKDHPNFLEHHELDMPEGMEYDREYHAKEVAKAQADHQDEWASPTGFKVKKRIDIMPGRQGTFPGENWNKYKGGGPYGGPDSNHPDNEQVRWGSSLPLKMQHDAYATHESLVNSDQFGHDWRKDPAPHSELREAAGRPQKRWATLFDQ